MDQVGGIAAAAAAESAEPAGAYQGMQAFSALPNSPVLGEIPSWRSRWRRVLRRSGGAR